MGDGRPHGILIANTGTPSAPTPRAVKSYLSKFLMSPRIVPMNRIAWWFILHFAILPKRARASAERYERIWTPEGSPLAVAHARLERALQRRFDDEDLPYVVSTGLSFGSPSVVDGLRELREAGCGSVTVVPLFPQSAYSTTGIVVDEVSRARKKLRWSVPVDFVDNYAENATYVEAMAALIRHSGFDPASSDRLVFSYHSIPLTDVEAGDTYELQVGSSSLRIAGELGIDRDRWTIAYQSRFDRKRDWLAPSANDVLDRMAHTDVARLFVVCPGFAVDCLETLLDIDEEARAYYLDAVERTFDPVERAAREFVYVPCLGATKAHVRVLHDVVISHERHVRAHNGEDEGELNDE